MNIIDVVGYTFEIFIADAREGSEMQIGWNVPLNNSSDSLRLLNVKSVFMFRERIRRSFSFCHNDIIKRFVIPEYVFRVQNHFTGIRFERTSGPHYRPYYLICKVALINPRCFWHSFCNTAPDSTQSIRIMAIISNRAPAYYIRIIINRSRVKFALKQLQFGNVSPVNGGYRLLHDACSNQYRPRCNNGSYINYILV